MTRWAVALTVTLASGCNAALDWSVTSSCEGSVVAIALERGDCGGVSGEPSEVVRDVEGADVMLEEREAGTHCFEAMAYRAEPLPEQNGYACRIEAASFHTVRLPEGRGALTSDLSCEAMSSGDAGAAAPGAPPAPVYDALARTVAGCCPDCDVERCVCGGGCRFEVGPTPEGAEPAEHARAVCADACPEPVQVRNLFATDTYVCGISLDRRSLWCWGESGPSVVGERLAESGGAAIQIPIDSLAAPSSGPDFPPAEVFLGADGEGGRLCFNTDRGLECIPRTDGAAATVQTPSTLAVTDSFVCTGESLVTCLDPMGRVTLTGGGLSGFSLIAATRGYVCAAIGRNVICATERRDCGVGRPCEAFSTCESGQCVARPLTELPAPAIRLEAGWGRVCAVLSTRDVHCWDVTAEGNPEPAPLGSPAGGPTKALDVSVGESTICYRDPKTNEVVCAGLRREAGWYALVDPVVVSTDPVDELVAGPDGLACVVRSEDARVVCTRPLHDDASESMLGTGHTRALASDSSRPVCP